MSEDESVTCVYLGTLTAQSYTIENPVFDVKRLGANAYNSSFNVVSGSMHIYTANEVGEVSESNVSSMTLLQDALITVLTAEFGSLEITRGSNETATSSEVEDKLNYKLSE